MSALSLIRRLASAVLIAWIAQAPIANAAFISLQPDTTFASNGDSVSVSLLVSGLGDHASASLGAFDISIEFDPSVLTFTGYTLGGLLGDVVLYEAIDGSFGANGSAVNVAEVSLLLTSELEALQPGEFMLAILSFDVFALDSEATTALSILPGYLLGDEIGDALPVSGTGFAMIEIATVPLPGAALLFMTAFSGLFCASRFRASDNKDNK